MNKATIALIFLVMLFNIISYIFLLSDVNDSFLFYILGILTFIVYCLDPLMFIFVEVKHCLGYKIFMTMTGLILYGYTIYYYITHTEKGYQSKFMVGLLLNIMSGMYLFCFQEINYYNNIPYRDYGLRFITNQNNLILPITNPVFQNQEYNNNQLHHFIIHNDELIQKNEICSICIENIIQTDKQEQIIKLNCNHYFHYNCILQWIQHKRQFVNCPNCRNPIHNYNQYQQPRVIIQYVI